MRLQAAGSAGVRVAVPDPCPWELPRIQPCPGIGLRRWRLIAGLAVVLAARLRWFVLGGVEDCAA